MNESSFKDVEHGKVALVEEKSVPSELHRSVVPETEVSHARKLQNSRTPLRWMTRGEQWLDKKLGIETQGIDRIPNEKKRPPSLWNCFFLWCTMVCHVGVLPIGILGPEFGLSLSQSISAIVVGVAIGAPCAAYTSLLGPKTGLRAIATSRYSFGFWGAKLCSILNIIMSGGFAVVNVVTTGQMLSAVSGYSMTISVGCIIISVVTYVLSVFGFAVIHSFERYAWIPSAVLLSVLMAQAAPHVDATVPSAVNGLAGTGVWLSFMSINFAGSAGWCSIAADYYCNYPADTKPWKVFALTYWGVVIPTVFTTVIGACIGNAAISAAYGPYAEVFEHHGLGGLIGEIFHPSSWSRFCLVVLTFSVVGNNVVNLYSSGLSLQLLGHVFHAVPRFIWSFLVAFVVAVMAIAGKDHLSIIVTNFLSMLGYWAIAFTVILLVENEWFRKGHPERGYNLSVWNDAARLPVGAAAVASLLAGYLGGGVTGMSQAWFVGPIAAKFGPYGGDVGIFLCFGITLLCYLPLRYLERRTFGR